MTEEEEEEDGAEETVSDSCTSEFLGTSNKSLSRVFQYLRCQIRQTVDGKSLMTGVEKTHLLLLAEPIRQ